MISQNSAVEKPTPKTRLQNRQMNHSLKQLFEEFHNAAGSFGFTIETYGTLEDWPLMAMNRKSGEDSGSNIYLSSGMHGDEPAGPLALLELLQEDSLPREHNYWICPVLNPSGLEAGTRENTDGLDLNRDYSSLNSKEIRAHVTWVKQNIQSLNRALHIHEDWESKGFYLYELNFGGHKSYSEKILEAAEQYLPIDYGDEIDGHPASGGIIRPDELPEVEDGDPEAIYFQNKFGGLNYTLESPSALPLEQRVAALKAAVLAALSL